MHIHRLRHLRIRLLQNKLKEHPDVFYAIVMQRLLITLIR